MAGTNGSYELRESTAAYEAFFGEKKRGFKARKCFLLRYISLKIK
jgi:hypothetical protein